MAGIDPRLQAAVENLDSLVADGAQHPPETGGYGAAAVVVGNNVVLASDAERAHRDGELIGLGQRVAPGAGQGTEVSFEIHVDRAGQVGGDVLLAAPLQVAQVPAGVGNAKLGIIEA